MSRALATRAAHFARHKSLAALGCCRALRRPPRRHEVRSARCGMTVAVRTDSMRHFVVRGRVVEQLTGIFYDGRGISANEARYSSGNTLWSLGRITDHQDRFSECWSFFLDAAGIGDHQVASAKQVNEFRVV